MKLCFSAAGSQTRCAGGCGQQPCRRCRWKSISCTTHVVGGLVDKSSVLAPCCPSFEKGVGNCLEEVTGHSTPQASHAPSTSSTAFPPRRGTRPALPWVGWCHGVLQCRGDPPASPGVTSDGDTRGRGSACSQVRGETRRKAERVVSAREVSTCMQMETLFPNLSFLFFLTSLHR